jgi:hypothetical protein
MLVRNVLVIMAKLSPMGIIAKRKVGRLTKGSINRAAPIARQKASPKPRVSAGHSPNQGALPNRPLRLHIKAAAMMNPRPQPSALNPFNFEIIFFLIAGRLA